VFVRDLETGETSRVSVADGGAEGAGISAAPSLSGDGRLVAFVSRAPNLVANDPNGTGLDVFVRDRADGRTVRLSPRRAGLWISFDPVVSRDGRFVAFAAERMTQGDDGELHEDGPRRVFVRALRTGIVEAVAVSSRERAARGESGEPSISADGRFVAFTSSAANLVRGDTRGKQDVFVRDRRRGTTTRVSIGSSGRQGGFPSFEPAISASGRFVAFSTRSHNLERGDRDGATDIYVRDRRRGTTRRVSRGVTGWATAPAISGDGRLVAYQLSPTDLVADGEGPFGRVIVRDRRAPENHTPADGSARSGSPALASGGSLLAFTSADPGLVPGDDNGAADVFAAPPR
jgi:Tol biopolymer transport system component